MERVKVYRDSGMPVKDGRGIFAGALLDRFPDLPVEEEGRLHDPRLRENFLERVFAYRRLRTLFADDWRPRDVIPASFGADSAKRHRELAEGAGVTLRELPLRSLSLDLDDPEDLEVFREHALGGRRTRRLLHELGVHE